MRSEAMPASRAKCLKMWPLPCASRPPAIASGSAPAKASCACACTARLTPCAVFRELESGLPWIPLLLILIGLKYPLILFFGVLLLLGRQTIYGRELARNHFPFSFIFYYVPAAVLYAGVLWASYRSHLKGIIKWKGREYAIGAPQSMK